MFNRSLFHLACVTFYTSYASSDVSDQLRLYGSSRGLGEWNIQNGVRAQRITSSPRWTATALLPKHEYVHLKWAVVNKDGERTAEERFVTPILWTARRSLTFKPFGGPPSMELIHSIKKTPTYQKDR